MLTNTQPLPRTIGFDLEVPKRRIANAQEAVSVAYMCIQDNRERSRKIAMLKGIVDGEPPFALGAMRKNGQGWRSNSNPYDAVAHLDAAMVPYYDLFGTQRYRIDIETDEGGDQAACYSRIITEEVDNYIREDPIFETEMRTMIYWRVGYGCGVLMWSDPWTPDFCSIQPDRVLVPKMSMCSVSKVEFVTIQVEYDVVELYRKVEDEDAGAEAGWNVTQVKMAIAAARNQAIDEWRMWDYVRFQQAIKNNEILTAGQFKKVKCAQLYCREFDGSISEYLVRMDTTASSASGVDDQSGVDFLFERHGQSKDMNAALSAFFQNSSEGYWHGATGQLQNTYNVLQLKMRVFNAIMDGGFQRAGPVVQASGANSYENAQIVQRGALTILPPGMSVQDATIYGDLNGVMAVSNYLDNIIVSNTGIYRPKLEKTAGNPITATEAEIKFQQSQSLSNSAVSRFMSELDIHYKEYVRRLLKVDIKDIRKTYRARVTELRAAITRRGVPKSAIDKIFRVEASRGLGNGARWLKTIEWQDAVLVSQLLSGRGAANFTEDLLASRYGYRLAKRWTEKAMPTPSDEFNLWQAQSETTQLKDGMLPFVTDDQDDFIHASEHLRIASDAANSVREGGDKVGVMVFLQGSGQHIAAHLQKIANSKGRQAEVKMMTEELMKLSKFTEDLQGLIEQEQAQAQEQQAAQMQAQMIQAGADPEVQIKRATAQENMRLKKDKQDATLALKSQKQRFDMASRVRGQNFDLALKDATTAHEIATQTAKNGEET
jgi:hypothetical protein